MKTRDNNILLAIDPSLTATGWVVFTIADAKPRSAGLIAPPGPTMPMSQRLEILQDAVRSLLTNMQFGKGDVLICEGPAPLVKNPLSALKVEQVRGIFESLARENGAAVPGRLNPRTVQTELLGMRGSQVKREEVKHSAREVAKKLFGSQLRSLKLHDVKLSNGDELPQDIIDALLIGCLSVSRVQSAYKTGVSLAELFSSRPTAVNKSSRRLGWTKTQVARINGEY